MGGNENDATVERMAGSAQRLLDDEVRRSESFRQRGGQLAVFAGAVFALLAGLVPDGIGSVPCAAAWVATALFVASSLLLLGSVFVAIVSVVYPQKRIAIGPREVANYTTSRFTTATPTQVQKRTIRALHRSLVDTSRLNRGLADALRLSGSLFLAGLSTSVLAAIIISIGVRL